MPQVNLSADEYIQRYLNNLQQQITDLQTQSGLVVVDNKLRTRVAVGLLPNGDFGVMLVDPSTGQATELLPVYTAQIATTESTSSTTYTDLATPGPTVTATVGQSGNAQVTINSYVGIPGATGGTQSAGFVGIYIDGSLAYDKIIYFSNSVVGTTAVGMAASQSAVYTFTGLSPGQHTFEMKYVMTGPGSVNFGERVLQVRPI